MWMLVKEELGEIFPMLPDTRYKVGRFNADLVIKNDKSISGTHAYLTTKKFDDNTDFLELEDIGSKNGSFINEDIKNRKPLAKNVPVKLLDGNIVQFGVMGNCWRVRYMCNCSAFSGLSSKEHKELVGLLHECGGKYVDVIDKHCTHLTMTELKVTYKLTKAFLLDIPVVDFSFWIDLLKVARKQKKGPMQSTKHYLPSITDVLLMQQNEEIDIQPDRKTVFVGKTFIFLTQKHYDTYASIVAMGGGTSRGLTNGVQKSFLLKKDVVVIQFIPSVESQNSQSTQILNTIAGYLDANSRRFIQEYEIALAIIYCSTDKYCNPDYKLVSNMISSISNSQNSESLLIENTSLQKECDSCDWLLLEPECSQKHSTQFVSTKSCCFNQNELSLLKNENSKNKRSIHNVVSSDSESDTEFSKRTKKQSVAQTFIKEKHSTLVIYEKEVTQKPFSCNTRKEDILTRMSNINESEDVLFDFGESAMVPSVAEGQRNIPICKIKSCNNSPSFGKKMNSSSHTLNSEKGRNDAVPTELLIPHSFSLGSQSLFKPKILPNKLSTEGWRASIRNISLISSKTGIEKNNDSESKNTSNSFDSFKGSFNVKITSFISSVKDVKKRQSVISKNGNENVCGVKKFVKQKILNQQ